MGRGEEGGVDERKNVGRKLARPNKMMVDTEESAFAEGDGDIGLIGGGRGSANGESHSRVRDRDRDRDRERDRQRQTDREE